MSWRQTSNPLQHLIANGYSVPYANTFLLVGGRQLSSRGNPCIILLSFLQTNKQVANTQFSIKGFPMRSASTESFDLMAQRMTTSCCFHGPKQLCAVRMNIFCIQKSTWLLKYAMNICNSGSKQCVKNRVYKLKPEGS